MTEQGLRKVKMFLVEKRDRDIFLPILLEHVKRKVFSVLDGWKAYYGLNSYFYDHNVVNYSNNLID
ncbi:hypothetical protein A0H76_425 [Hepatospora eriocheir]|uniref:ISXO2-like transposase domain-containing protein n=1 Tax=Hepatospora eriocheir TaxID=1081669 RepID=A0A1X0QJ15_9MICR|nr:hypothetical protein A0H76_425 [Hepatospora eriocheir]